MKRSIRTIKNKIKEIDAIRIKHTRKSMSSCTSKKLSLILEALRYCLGEGDLIITEQ